MVCYRACALTGTRSVFLEVCMPCDGSSWTTVTEASDEDEKERSFQERVQNRTDS